MVIPDLLFKGCLCVCTNYVFFPEIKVFVFVRMLKFRNGSQMSPDYLDVLASMLPRSVRVSGRSDHSPGPVAVRGRAHVRACMASNGHQVLYL